MDQSCALRSKVPLKERANYWTLVQVVLMRAVFLTVRKPDASVSWKRCASNPPEATLERSVVLFHTCQVDG